MSRILGQFRRVLALCLSSAEGRFGLVQLALVLALNLASVAVSLRLIAWTADFYNALEKLDGGAALRQIGVFAILIGINVARDLAAAYTRKLLEIRWRRVLTGQVLDRWLAEKAYWRLKTGSGTADVADNPDQRIAEDCRLFLSGFLREGIDLITSIVGVFSYLAVLWSLSSFPLAFSLFGFDVEVPRYMVWAAFLYVALSSGLTHLLGRPLKNLFFQQQRLEGDFRFALARFRESTDEIALSDGEPAERRLLDRRFSNVVSNWMRLIQRELVLGLFTRPYQFTVLRIPLFLALPAYFAGNVTLGGLMQLGSAFSNVVTTLSWFIFSYRDLADLVAASSRLNGFLDVMDQAKARPTEIERAVSKDGRYRISGLKLRAPDGRLILALPDADFRPGETVWISGPSGTGKSTLLKALAGLWLHGEGRIEYPDAPVMFLSQRPYLPLDGIRAAAAYPRDPAEIGNCEIEALLERHGLSAWLGAEGEDSMKGLSGGEQQRLSLLRLMISRPRWAFLDEATSALDAEAEAGLLKVLRDRLPDTTFVLVAHREPVGPGELRRMALVPNGERQAAE